MNDENKTPRKDIIKNIAIIFLAAMLVLTLFSNTFMNYSLPQVSTVRASQGTISEQIRGSGTVEPAESYEIKFEQTRNVKSVLVKAGQEVKSGDVLFELEDSDSTELTEAQNTLESLRLEYDKAVLAMSKGSGYSADLLAISNAQAELSELKDDLAEAQNRPDIVGIADDAYKSAKAEVDSLTREKDELTAQLASVDTEDMLDLSPEHYERLRTAKDKVTSCEKALEDAQKAYDDAVQNASAEGDTDQELKDKQKELRSAQAALNELYNQYYGADPESDTSAIISQIAAQRSTIEEIQIELSEMAANSTHSMVLKTKVDQTEKSLKKATNNLSSAKDKLAEETRSITLELKKKIDSVDEKLRAANDILADAESDRSDAQTESQGYETVSAIETKIRDKEKEIADLKAALEIKQSDDSLETQTAQLDLNAKQKEIERQQEKVDKLRGEAFDAVVKAKMGGVVESISVTAGESVEAGRVAAVINVSDKGYTLEFPVKVEQAKKVKVGDKAEITSWYFGNDFSAVISEIRPDTNNPNTQKILVFNISGSDIATGQSISLAMGSKGQAYSTVVPNSAIREDSNGKFVLVMESKSSPLGNRYTAVRYDVEVVVKDDNNSAVNGLMGSEFVITTSTKPISAGEQIRPAE